MKEAKGDLWEMDANYRCITTNGFVKNNGEAVMGRGCAKEAATKWKDLPEVLGDMIQKDGNHVTEVGYSITTDEPNRKTELCAWDVIAFPVKHHWREKADLALIERSAHELVEFIDRQPENFHFTVLLPRPGCGNGQLAWEDVKPILEPILDDRFVAVTFDDRS